MASYVKTWAEIAALANTYTDADKTGQESAIAGREDRMHENHAGGVGFVLSSKDQITNALILGTTTNSFYATKHELTEEFKKLLTDIISAGQGQIIVECLYDIYTNNRAPKLDPLFFCLAVLTQVTTPLDVRRNAFKLISELRTLSHVYSWKTVHKLVCNTKGFGRGIRTALCTFITSHKPMHMAYQITKYRERCGWSFDDLVSCIHIVGKKCVPGIQVVLAYGIHGIDKARICAATFPDNAAAQAVLAYLDAVESVRYPDADASTAIPLILTHNLPREVLSTHLLNECSVWHALLLSPEGFIKMPITALIRNLAKMTSIGLFDALNGIEIASKIVAHLCNITVLKRGYIHPVALLSAHYVYASGHGIKGSLSWTPQPLILAGLMSAYYVAFGTVEPTNKRIMWCQDISGSMSSASSAIPLLTAMHSGLAMMMACARSEPLENLTFFTFSYTNDEYEERYGHRYDYNLDRVMTAPIGTNKWGRDIKVTSLMELPEVTKICNECTMGSTDCSLPMVRAEEELLTGLQAFRIENPDACTEDYIEKGHTSGIYDCFIIHTDNETYAGKEQPQIVLERYRKLVNRDVKLIVIAATPGADTIGDPHDPSVLNIAGFDLNAPKLIRSHIVGTSEGQTLQAEDAEEE